ncbi:uncharacterized protein PSFLO_00764 [Pseudozyma flocculosa]|uniref:Uncharacterized protein n=1 Tax=Pseudozyma flocculosa TaxID=84751 RepID=A0A5C3ESI9_9BASI|nr:uncharacterized protein PSFLO_00764 [Pseudozyma flocculosa]
MVKAFGIAGVVAIALAMSAAAAPISRLDGSDIGLVKRDLPHGGNDDEIPDPDYPPRKRDFGDPHVVAVGGSRPPLHNDKRDFGDPHVVAVGGSRPPLHNDKRDFGDPHVVAVGGSRPPLHNDKRDFGDPHVVAVGRSRPPLHNDKRSNDGHDVIVGGRPPLQNDKRTIDGGEPPISPAPGSGVVHVKPVSPGDQHIANPGQHNR